MNRERLLRWILPLICASMAAAQSLVIQDVSLIDVRTGSVAAHQSVAVQDGFITFVGPAAVSPARAQIIDGRGKFLIPGLWDMHVHLYHKPYLPLFLAYGVTGVQDMGSDFQKTKAWREEIDKGASLGPRIITSGPPVDGVASEDPNLPVIVARSANEAREAFDRLYKLNVDFIKVLSSLPREAYFALAELARHWDLRLEGHVPTTVTAQEAVEARQKTLEHLFGVTKAVPDDEQARRFFARCALTGTRITPTLVLWQRMSHFDDVALMNNPQLAAIPPAIRQAWPDISEDTATLRRQIWRIYRLTSLAHESHAEILAGTDTGDPFVMPGAALQDELQQLVEAGLTPLEALQAATIAPARFLELESKLGTIEKGKGADMVLLDANPLENICNIKQIRGVMFQGRYLSYSQIMKLLAPQ